MLASDRYFIDQFHANFSSLRGNQTPIVLYGVGEKTRLLLDHLRDYQVIGLMDRESTGKTIYGHPVLSETDVIARAKHIIIVANMSMAPIIYERIRALKEDRGIEIHYINGTKPPDFQTLSDPSDATAGRERLKHEIDEHDVISFDLFDTLIMRNVLTPVDIFSVVERELSEKRGLSLDFKNKRIEAEHACFRNRSPYCNLEDIYAVLQSLLNLDDRTTADILQLEIETELKFSAPRPAVIEWLRYAKKQGKTVLITTDTFWTKDRVLKLLDRYDIQDYDFLLISCEIKKLKYLGDMWQHIRELFPQKGILHIGDNPLTDVKIPQQYGIRSFKIENAFDLLNTPPFRHLAKPPVTTDGSVLLGRMSARFFSDPWILHEHGGRLPIDDPFSLGYLSFGPLVLNYLLWLIRESTRRKMDKLLFFARDGYLLRHLYLKLIRHYRLRAADPIYFLTSRRAASVAAVENEQDIIFILNHVCKIKSIRIDQLLMRAFGVLPDADDVMTGKRCYELDDNALTQHIIGRYGAKILQNASDERRNYLAYIKTLDLTANSMPGCVNFVGRGITQLFVSRILKKELTGFYFAREVDMLDIFDRPDQCHALYEDFISPHMGRSQLSTKYIFGEIIFSSPDEQLINFDVAGLPSFEAKSVKRDFENIRECHAGVERFIDDMMALDDHLLTRNFPHETVDQFYGLFSTKSCVCSERLKKNFVFSDFYNPDHPELNLPF